MLHCVAFSSHEVRLLAGPFVALYHKFLKNMEKVRKQMNSPDERYGYTDLTGAERVTGLSKSSIYKMTSSRKLKFYKPTGKLLFKISELVEFIENSKN
jgi:excisionase family DNA binding protein